MQDATDLDWAIRTARREAGDRADPPVWNSLDWTDAVTATAFGAPPRLMYDPYLAAASFLASPDTLKSRRLGDVAEEFVDPAPKIRLLREQSVRLRAGLGFGVGPVVTAWGP